MGHVSQLYNQGKQSKKITWGLRTMYVEREYTRDVACFQIKAKFINTSRKRQDTRSFNKIKDCLIGPLKLALA